METFYAIYENLTKSSLTRLCTVCTR